jgi:dTDP-4-amino-4,6-dideoxygalactose transaminase
MNLPEPHPDLHQDYHAFKQIQRGGMQAIEDKAIAEYMRVFKEEGREAAEKIFLKHFNKDHGKQKS